MSDNVEFQCSACGAVAAVDEDNPPDDSDPLLCPGCGANFGPYGEAKAKMIEMAKAYIDRLVQSKLGVKPKWTKR